MISRFVRWVVICFFLTLWFMWWWLEFVPVMVSWSLSTRVLDEMGGAWFLLLGATSHLIR